VLEKMGISAEMKPRIRSSSNMASVVESGEAEIGITGVGAGLTYTQLEFIGHCPPRFRSTSIWQRASARMQKRRSGAQPAAISR
jgi:hypothetical protein